jgi:hypothetical protein
MLFKNILFLSYLVLTNTYPISIQSFRINNHRRLHSIPETEDLGSNNNYRRLNDMTGTQDLGSNNNYRRLNDMTGTQDLGSNSKYLRH